MKSRTSTRTTSIASATRTGDGPRRTAPTERPIRRHSGTLAQTTALVVDEDVGVQGLLMSIDRGLRNYLWYWTIMVAVALVLALVFGGSFGVILLGVVFGTFLLLIAYMFIELWLD